MKELDFSRQVCLPEVGEAGQAKLRASKVLVVGAGGTGSPAIMYLASAGVGRVDVCDPDIVELSNLHRQPLHKAVGELKAASASSWIRERGSWCEWSQQRLEDVRRFTPNSKAQRVDYDVILDCTDRWSSHRDVILSGIRAGKKIVHGSIGGLLGRVCTFSSETPCWLCLHPERPEGVNDIVRGTLGPVCGIVGSMMAMEALKILLGLEVTTLGTMVTVEAATLRFSKFELSKEDGCAGCGSGGQARLSTPSIVPPSV